MTSDAASSFVHCKIRMNLPKQLQTSSSRPATIKVHHAICQEVRLWNLDSKISLQLLPNTAGESRCSGDVILFKLNRHDNICSAGLFVDECPDFFRPIRDLVSSCEPFAIAVPGSIIWKDGTHTRMGFRSDCALLFAKFSEQSTSNPLSPFISSSSQLLSSALFPRPCSESGGQG